MKHSETGTFHKLAFWKAKIFEIVTLLEWKHTGITPMYLFSVSVIFSSTTIKVRNGSFRH